MNIVSLPIARLLTVGVALLMTILFLNPIAVSVTYLLLRPLLQPFAYHHYPLIGPVPLTSLFSVLLIIIAYFNALTNKKSSTWHMIMLPLYGLLFFSILSIANTPSYYYSVAGLIKILCGISMYVLVFNAVQKREQLRTILWCIVLSSLIPMAIGYYQFVTKTGHAWKSAFYASRRPDSCFGEWNIYGEFLCVCIVTALMLLLLEKGPTIKKILLGIILTLLVSSLVISLNRGSWVSLSAGVVISSLVFIKKVKLRWIVLTALIIFVSTGGFIYKRFQQLDEKWDGYSQNTLQGRIDYWQKLIPLIVDKPLIGYGIGSSVIVGDQYFKKGMAPHNDYLRLALETGIPGALLYLIFLYWVFLKELFDRIKKRWEIGYPILILIVYVIVLSAFQNIIYNVTIFPMFTALLAISHKSSHLLDSK
jgi:O-antigen ligase